MANVFLSYGRLDASELARHIKSDLEAAGHTVWQDTTEIHAGAPWEEQISKAVGNSDAVVGLLSPHAVRTRNDLAGAPISDSVCLDELLYARFGPQPKPVIPVMAVQCVPPLSVFRLDYVDLTGFRNKDAYQHGFNRLMGALTASLKGGSQFRRECAWLHPLDFGHFIFEKTWGFQGRHWLFERVFEWSSKNSEKALLITGEPGIGKTTFLAEFAHRNPPPSVIAHYFCQASVAETLRPSRFVQTLSAQLAQTLPELASRLEQSEARRLLEQVVYTDPESALELGLMACLNAIAAPDGTRFILIDGLDEVVRGTVVSPSIVTLLDWQRLEKLPGWIRLIATSRRDPAVLSRLAGIRAQGFEAYSTDNQNDVASFISSRLQAPALQERLVRDGLSAEGAKKKLLNQSGGNFLYASLVLQAVERDIQSFHQIDIAPRTIPALYEREFDILLPSDSSEWNDSKEVVGRLIASPRPVPDGILFRNSSLRARRVLTPFLRRDQNGLVPFHESLRDWFEDEDNSWHVEKKLGLKSLAQLGLAALARPPQTDESFWLVTLENVLAELDDWSKLSDLLTDESGFLRLYPTMYDYSHEWSTLVQPFPHLLHVLELCPPSRKPLMLDFYVAAFGKRAGNILTKCRWAIEAGSVLSVKERSDKEFAEVRDQLYTFVYMAAQTIQLQILASGSEKVTVEILQRICPDVLRFLHLLAWKQPDGVSGKLSDQADYAYGALKS